MNLAPREKFGLGSKLKRFVRKVIPNEVSDIAVKAAPFVAPFNPALAGAMAGIGGFDQTGSIGKSVKAGLITYGLGQGARYLGGAGFQGNPFVSGGAFTPSGFMSGFSSPLGTQTGIGKLLADKGYIQTDAQKAGKLIADEAQKTAAAADLDSYAGIEEYLMKTDPSQLTLSQKADLVAQDLATKTKPGYKDLFSKVIQPDATLSERTAAIKDLGGKALKDIYTKPIPGEPGKTQIDKLAVGATIAGAASYMEAKKLAEEADLVDDADDYTEEMYEADKARYSDYYSKILTPEAFGIRAQEADGGLLSLRKMKQDGSVPEEFISYTDDESGVIYRDPDGNPITKAEAMKAFDEMPEEDQIITDMEGKPLGEPEVRKRILPMPKPKEFVFEGRLKRLMEAKDMLQPESFEYLLNELKEEMTESGIPSIKLEKKATGGRVGLETGGTPVYLKDSILKDQDFLDAMKESGELEGILQAILENKKLPTEKEYSRGLELIESAPSKAEKFAAKYLDKAESFDPEKMDPSDRLPMEMLVANKMLEDRGKSIDKLDEEAMQMLKDMGLYEKFMEMEKKKFKKGGRAKYAMGSEVPIRDNGMGTKEMDFRQTGGFVPPIGVKEKADDIPAMLSNNEFVFTADAVRAAGGGSVNKGAQKMYKLMKSLENKVV